MISGFNNAGLFDQTGIQGNGYEEELCKEADGYDRSISDENESGKSPQMSDEEIGAVKVQKDRIPTIFAGSDGVEMRDPEDLEKRIRRISKRLVEQLGYSKEDAHTLALQILKKEQEDPLTVAKFTHRQANGSKGFSVKNEYVHFHDKEFIAGGHYKDTYKASRLNIETGEMEKIVHQKGKQISFTKAIKREFRLQKKFDHPHIVKMYDSIVYGPNNKIAIYAEKCGNDIKNCIKNGTLSFEQKMVVARDTASALDYVHKEGYSHNDIKADNVLLKSKRAKLTDFGLSKPIGSDYRGLKKIYAPEIVNSYIGTDKTDTWQYGIFLWELFHPNPPKEHFDPEYQYPPVSEMFQNWPAQTSQDRIIQSLIAGCCDPDPEKRPSMEEIEKVLSEQTQQN